MAAEVSSAGWRKPVGEQYPALGLLERFVAGGVPLTTASDAHRLEHVADRADDLRAVLGAAGAGVLQGYRGRTPYAVPVTGLVEEAG
jgi:histidinol-phosphatase (PHP family)